LCRSTPPSRDPFPFPLYTIAYVVPVPAFKASDCFFFFSLFFQCDRRFLLAFRDLPPPPLIIPSCFFSGRPTPFSCRPPFFLWPFTPPPTFFPLAALRAWRLTSAYFFLGVPFFQVGSSPTIPQSLVESPYRDRTHDRSPIFYSDYSCFAS